MNPVTARACCRLDLAGGTLDIWPLGLLHPGARTVNVAIDIEVTVRLERRDRGFRVRQGETVHEAPTPAELRASPDTALVGVVAEELGLPPCEVVLASESPRGGGLGASSAMMVALLAAGEALVGRDSSSPARLARVARDLEAQMMGLPTGLQDHYPALLGGALEIRHEPGGERVQPLRVDLAELGDHLVVVYSGQSHFSAATNWQIIRRRLESDPETTLLLDGIAAAAAELPAALEAGDYPRVGELVAREWSCRSRLAGEVSTPQIERLLGEARSLGAWGGKACGAGGGGCVLILYPPERRQAIAQGVARLGGQVLAARPSKKPLRVT